MRKIILLSFSISFLFSIDGKIVFYDGTTVDGQINSVNMSSIYITPIGLNFPEEILKKLEELLGKDKAKEAAEESKTDKSDKAEKGDKKDGNDAKTEKDGKDSKKVDKNRKPEKSKEGAGGKKATPVKAKTKPKKAAKVKKTKAA